MCALLVIGAFVVFGPVARFEFIQYDDPDFVLNNPHVQQGLTSSEIGWAFKSLYIYWQPLTWISYMLDMQLYGLSAKGFHFTNLALHIANTLLLFLALKRMTKAHWQSALVAALFAFHPLHVETVAWISERKGVLCTTFWMLTMLCYARYVEKPRSVRYMCALLAFALGLMCKSMIVTLPCVLLLLDFWPLGRLRWGAQSTPDKSSLRGIGKLLLEKTPFFALAGVSGFLTVLAQRKGGAVWTLEQLPFTRRISQSLFGYVEYLRKMVWPNDLAIFYPYNSVPWVSVAIAVVVLSLVTVWVIMQIRKRPYLAVGWAWYLGTLFPVIGLFQTGEQALADRYTYIPLIGIFIMIIWGLGSVLSGKESATNVPSQTAGPAAMSLPARAIGFVLVGVCAFSTMYQLQHWRTTRLLFEHTQRVAGPNYLALAILGNLESQAGNLNEAMNYLRASLDLHPAYPETLVAYGALLLQKRQFPEALEAFQKALQIKPKHLDALVNSGVAFQAQGQLDTAVAQFKKALEIDPTLTRVHYLLGRALMNQRKLEESLVHMREAARLKPDWPEAFKQLAWVIVIQTDPAKRDAKEAIAHATRACQLTSYQDASALNALAAAQAESGSYTEAVQTSQKAIDLAQASGQKELAEYFIKFQKLYQQNRPCRDLAE